MQNVRYILQLISQRCEKQESVSRECNFSLQDMVRSGVLRAQFRPQVVSQRRCVASCKKLPGLTVPLPYILVI